MQVGIDVTCMYINFGGCDLYGFGDTSPWSSKNLIDWNRLKKFMQVGIDVTYMYINFGGHDLYGFGDTATFKNGQISLSDYGL